MNEIRTLFYGIAGGVLGSFFRFWIQDLRDWAKSRLTSRERELIRYMKQENGVARFSMKVGQPPSFESRLEHTDQTELNFKFEDNGEISRLLEMKYIEKLAESSQYFEVYRLTGKGHHYSSQ